MPSWPKGAPIAWPGRPARLQNAYRRTLRLALAADHRIMVGSAATFVAAALTDEGEEINPTEHLQYLDIVERYRVNVDAVLASQARHLHIQGHAVTAGVMLGPVRPYASVNRALAPAYDTIQEHLRALNGWTEVRP